MNAKVKKALKEGKITQIRPGSKVRNPNPGPVTWSPGKIIIGALIGGIIGAFLFFLGALIFAPLGAFLYILYVFPIQHIYIALIFAPLGAFLYGREAPKLTLPVRGYLREKDDTLEILNNGCTRVLRKYRKENVIEIKRFDSLDEMEFYLRDGGVIRTGVDAGSNSIWEAIKLEREDQVLV